MNITWFHFPAEFCTNWVEATWFRCNNPTNHFICSSNIYNTSHKNVPLHSGPNSRLS